MQRRPLRAPVAQYLSQPGSTLPHALSRTQPHEYRSCLPGLVLIASGCSFLSDTVTSQYATLADARANRIFERGWLPDVLPGSSYNIITSNNLDLDTSTGEFSFDPSDGQELRSRLKPGAPLRSRFAGWPGITSNYKRDGFSAFSYQQEQCTWSFFCRLERGECIYFMW